MPRVIESEATKVSSYIADMQEVQAREDLGSEYLESQSKVDLQIIPEEDTPIEQHMLVQLLLNDTFRKSIREYYHEAITEDNAITSFRLGVESDKHDFTPTPETEAAKDKAIENLDRELDLIPLADEPRGKEVFDLLQGHSDSVTIVDILTMDEIFESEREIDNLRLMLFLAVGTITKPNEWSIPQLRVDKADRRPFIKLRDRFIQYIQNVHNAANRYFSFYRYYFYSEYTNPGSMSIPGNIQPEDLRSAFAAAMFARTTEILPERFNHLIHDNLFPELTDETKSLLIGYYQSKFEKAANVRKVPDDEGYYPYGLSQQSEAGERGINYFRSLVDRHLTSNDLTETTNRENINWLIDPKTFTRVQKMAQLAAMGLHPENNTSAIDISSYNPNLIDITFIADDEIAHTLQIDKTGNIIGIPRDMQKEGVAYINYQLGKLREIFEQARDVRTIKTPTTTPSENIGFIGVPTYKIVTTTQTLPTREERIANYSPGGRSEVKRKQLREQGLLPPLDDDNNDETNQPQTNDRREGERSFAIDLQPTNRYDLLREDILSNKPNLAKTLQRILNRLATDPDFVRGHLKPLTYTNPRYPDIKISSARLGIDYRIKFATSTTRGQLIITSVQPRGIAYNPLQLEEDCKTAQEFLDNQ